MVENVEKEPKQATCMLTPDPTLPPEPNPLDPALVEKLATCKMIVMIDKLLHNGIFQGGSAAEIVVAIEFLQKLHAPIIKECQTHPEFERATNAKPNEPPPTPIKQNRAARRKAN